MANQKTGQKRDISETVPEQPVTEPRSPVPDPYRNGESRGGSQSGLLANPPDTEAVEDQIRAAVREDRASYPDTAAQREALKLSMENAAAQSASQIDNATAQGVNELARTREDAEARYDTQLNQIDLDAARARDNAALYAAAQGNRGGIAREQVSGIDNAAARNRAAVNSARIQMASDTQRQIAELRREGEFKKADALLQLTQQYLAQLRSLEQWAAQQNLNVDKFNASLDRWAASYSLQLQKLRLSAWQWQTRLAYGLTSDDSALRSRLAVQLLQSGYLPQDTSLLDDAGIDADYAEYLAALARIGAAS